MRVFKVWLPSLANMTGIWYDQDGREITVDEAAERFRTGEQIEVAHDTIGRSGGVLTVFAPFDLKHDPEQPDRPPFIYATAEWKMARRFGRKPVPVAEYTGFHQTRTAALAAHDQAVANARREARQVRWKLWRRLYWPPVLTVMCTIYGFINLAWLVGWVAYRLAKAAL